MEAALGTGQMSHIAAPGDWLWAAAVHLIKPAVSLIPLINDCVYCVVVSVHGSQCINCVSACIVAFDMCETALCFHYK